MVIIVNELFYPSRLCVPVHMYLYIGPGRIKDITNYYHQDALLKFRRKRLNCAQSVDKGCQFQKSKVKVRK